MSLTSLVNILVHIDADTGEEAVSIALKEAGEGTPDIPFEVYNFEHLPWVRSSVIYALESKEDDYRLLGGD